jgi:hypothetical protein
MTCYQGLRKSVLGFALAAGLFSSGCSSAAGSDSARSPRGPDLLSFDCVGLMSPTPTPAYAEIPKAELSSSSVPAPEQTVRRGDLLRVYVAGEKEISKTYLIDDKGQIALGFVGRVTVVGLTAKQVQKKIRGVLLGEYLKKPVVGVSFEKGKR